jgi:acetylornithine deacetylase
MIDVAGLLARLVAIDSRNPALAPEAPGEAAIAAAVADVLGRAGLDVTLVGPAARPSVIGRLRGAGGRGLILNGHMDTVGFGGMAGPLEPRTVGGRLYGRGAYDMKGGLAAILGAAVALAGGEPAGDLIVMAVADEEHASLGTEAGLAYLADAGVAADGAIVTEPTDLQICVAHKGFAWARITTEGRAAHGSRRADGVDAIAHMGRALGALEALDAALQTRPAHPLLGHGSLHASLIGGGTELSTYPAACRLDLERRTLPGETGASVAAELEAGLAPLRAADPRFRAQAEVTFFRPPLETPADHRVVRALRQAAATRLGAAPALVGATFWMDAALLAAAGAPAVAFGPVGAGLHGDEEWVDLESVAACADTLVAAAQAFWARQ